MSFLVVRPSVKITSNVLHLFLQCNELNRGHPTLISQSQITFTTKDSGFGSLLTNPKREHFFKFQSVFFFFFFSVAPVEFVAL